MEMFIALQSGWKFSLKKKNQDKKKKALWSFQTSNDIGMIV
jgi:hypothetical protein